MHRGRERSSLPRETRQGPLPPAPPAKAEPLQSNCSTQKLQLSSTGTLWRFQPLDHAGQDPTHRLFVHAHQDRVLKRILQSLRQFGVVLAKHAQLLATGNRGAVGLRPDCGRRGNHGFCAPGWVSPPFGALVMLKMNLPSRSSRLIDPWVMVMLCPGCNMVPSPPGCSDRYLPPSRLSLEMIAALSFGNLMSSRTDSDTTAWKLCGSIRSCSTLPTLTPAIRTSAP